MKLFKFLCPVVLMVIHGSCVMAQDILVTNEGESMKVYNTEIGQNMVFYQLEDNPNADTKKIAKKDVMIIKKQDGTKIDPNASTQNTSAQNASEPNGSAAGLATLAVNPNLAEDNLNLVKAFNERKVNWSSKNDKKANNQLYQLAIKEGSIIETPELSVTFGMKCWWADTNGGGIKIKKEGLKNRIKPYYEDHYSIFYPECPAFEVTLTNKSGKTIFIDLGNSFFIVYGKSRAYYHPESTSVTSGSSGGAGVNLGSIANAVGIGGTLGTLAGGVNVGGGTSSASTKVIYSQRVISIPPHSSYSMTPRKLLVNEDNLLSRETTWLLQDYVFHKNNDFMTSNGWKGKKDYRWSDNFTKGTIVELPVPKDELPFSVFITYSANENLQGTANINAGFYVSKVYSLYDKDDIDLSENPLVYWGEP